MEREVVWVMRKKSWLGTCSARARAKSRTRAKSARMPQLTPGAGKAGSQMTGLRVTLLLMARKKITVYLDEELLRATKVAAARQNKREYEVFEEALRRYLGLELLERIWQRADLTEEEALALAYSELEKARKEH